VEYVGIESEVDVLYRIHYSLMPSGRIFMNIGLYLVEFIARPDQVMKHASC